MHGVMLGAMHFLLAAALGQAAAASQAILPDPAASKAPQYISVLTSASAHGVSPGSRVSLFVDVTPHAGIHVYAPGAEHYLPIELSLKGPAGLSAGATVYPKSEKILFAQEVVPVYDEPFRLAREVTVPATAKAGDMITIAGVIDYQACDDAICFKPAVVPVTWTLTVK
jgi:DsbC/DsbD-like thiol-disulfide interchange protein